MFIGVGKLRVVLISLFMMVGFFVCISDVKAESYMIAEDTIWSTDHTIDGAEGLIVVPGVTLTIETGVTVTMNPGSNVLVMGSLILNGSSDDPIEFTSSSDSKTSDWGAIMINDPTAVVEANYVRIKYGGNPMGVLIVNQAQGVVLDNCEIIDNFGGIITNSPNLQINNSNIYNPNSGEEYLGTIILNNSEGGLNLTNNYWGHELGPTVNPPEAYGTWISGEADYEPFFSSPIEFVTPVYGCIDEEAKNYDEEATEDDGSCDYSPDPVILVPGILGSWNMGRGWELDPILHIYDNLWRAFENAGYTRGVDLFAFPYNWRLANTYTAMELKNKIDEVKAICNCDKVDIVAHSMGGLVVRAYVELLNYENDIDQLVFLATPQRGATKAYLMWEGGEFGDKRWDKIKQRVFKMEAELNGYPSVYDYLQNMPVESVKELLPIDDYLKNPSGDLKEYSENYPVNSFLDVLNSDLALARLDDLKITNVVGDIGNASTLSYIRVKDKEFDDGKWSHGYPEDFSSIFGDHGLEYDNGDGTVPRYSNSNFMGKDDIILGSSHNDLVTDAQFNVMEELTGVRPTEEVKENIFSKFLMIRIFSPADINVLSPDGKKVGKDFGLNKAINEIDGSFYTGFSSEPEFILIPNPINGEYQINLKGVASGEYRVSVSYLDDDTEADKEYRGNISLDEEVSFTINLSGNSLDELKIVAKESNNNAITYEVFKKCVANHPVGRVNAIEAEEVTEVADVADVETGIGGAPSSRLIKLDYSPAVYYVDVEGVRHLFPTEDIYYSWFDNYLPVEVISQYEFDQFLVGTWVSVNPEVGVVKFDNSNRVYSITDLGELKEVDSSNEAMVIPVAFEYMYLTESKKYLIVL